MKTEKNQVNKISHKDVDWDLVMAFDRIINEIRSEPQSGIVTTEELINEIRARVDGITS